HEHSSGTNQDISFDTNLSTNRWYYIYFTRDVTTNTVSFYVDGALISSQTYTTDPNGGSTSEFALGTRYGADDFYFNGMLDDVKVYNYVRTQGQIIEDMNGGHPAPGSPVGSTVGHWKFDEGYGDTTYDKSPQVNNGDLAGSCPGAATCPTWSNDGKYGKVLSFDGGDYVSVVDTTALDITPAITLSAWTNFGAALGNYETILGKRDASATEANYGLRNGTGANADEIEFYWATSTVWQVYTTNNANLSTSTWYHILATYDGTNVKIYKDGVLLTGTCTTGTCVTALAADNNTFGIGRAGDYASEYMTGSIDEVKIYPFALTADQVKTVYNQGKAIVMGSTSTDSSGNPQTGGNWEYCPPGSATSCTGPILEWKMDEGSGTSANDASGNGSTGTLTSGPTWQTGKKGSAINFDGTDDYITVANPYGASQTAASFSVWVNFDDPTVVQNIFFRLFGDPLYPRLRTHSGTTLQLQYERDTTIDSLADASITTKCPSNTWCHIAGTFATTGTYLYVNGILVASDTTAVTTFDGGSNALQMGWDSNLSTFMKGKIDDFRLYDYARTAAQIAWEYNRGAPVAHYKFDECQGTTVQDWSPAASGGFGTNDGTITIGATGTNDGPGSCNSGDTSEAWRNGTTGKINASLDFDGTDDYVDFGDISSWDFTATQSFSINFWFKTSVAAPSSDAVMFSKYRASGTTQVWYAALNNSTNYPRFAIYDGTNNPDAVGTTALNDGSWHHYVGVRNVTDDKLYLYIDGKLVNSDTDTTTATLANSHKAHVGGLLNSSDTGLTANTQFDGQIDDVRIYNYALTAAQVKDVMNNGAVRFE
ncbi:LamG domain-containing protein, partial [Candidatus Roizmanbacteria bacterium]|nr:LamG domain-containing protein [Candidatus Roizmanbacteria bacterium]